jgi:hypothetical protein
VTLTPIQATSSTKQTETKAEATEAGRLFPRREVKRGKRKVNVDVQGRPKIEGGAPLPTGDLSNVALSGRRYRAYGRRILAP